MEPSSTGVLDGFLPLVIQPFKVFPSKRRIQPSFFSFSVSSLSAARRPPQGRRERIQRRARSFSMWLMMCRRCRRRQVGAISTVGHLEVLPLPHLRDSFLDRRNVGLDLQIPVVHHDRPGQGVVGDKVGARALKKRGESLTRITEYFHGFRDSDPRVGPLLRPSRR